MMGGNQTFLLSTASWAVLGHLRAAEGRGPLSPTAL